MFSPEEINLLLGSYFSAVKTALCEMIKAWEQRERPGHVDKETVSFDGQGIVSSYRKGENSRRKKERLESVFTTAPRKSPWRQKEVND